MTNKEQAEQYIKKQKLLGQVKFQFGFELERDWIHIEQNKDYKWTEQDTELIIPPFVTHVEYRGFQDNNYIRKVTFKNPEIILKIETAAFDCCSGLEEIELPPNISIISEKLFRECRNLKQINIPNRVEEICSSAFYECIGLKKIKIDRKKSRLCEYDECVFRDCTKLGNVDYLEDIVKRNNR